MKETQIDMRKPPRASKRKPTFHAPSSKLLLPASMHTTHASVG
jgi:hypothetical protein